MSSHGNQAQSAALEWADTVTIEVDWPASSSAAIKAGVEDWQAWQFERGNYDADGQGADAATKRRWARNYLRNCATTYEEQLAALFGVVGKDDAYQRIKLRVEEMIEERFPDLAELTNHMSRDAGKGGRTHHTTPHGGKRDRPQEAREPAHGQRDYRMRRASTAG